MRLWRIMLGVAVAAFLMTPVSQAVGLDWLVALARFVVVTGLAIHFLALGLRPVFDWAQGQTGYPGLLAKAAAVALLILGGVGVGALGVFAFALLADGILAPSRESR
jgi:hypothetical protein